MVPWHSRSPPPPDPALLDLPWSTPLEDWPEELLAALPRGISRHIVRFVKVSGRVIAVKEIKDDLARREYHMLRLLQTLDLPCVEPFGVVSGRTTADGEPLDAVPGHPAPAVLPAVPGAVHPDACAPTPRNRLVDALAVLLVRLHLTGFCWGDVSLSNTLFRRDAGAFAAYLVDAETGELRDRSPTASASTTSSIARVNIAGELMDLEAGGLAATRSADPIEISPS